MITEDVPADALAFGRARQKTMPGKGKELRERFARPQQAPEEGDEPCHGNRDLESLTCIGRAHARPETERNAN